MEDRRGRITGVVSLPKMVVAAEPPEPGSAMPKKIGFKSRLAERVAREVDGLAVVSLVPNPYEELQNYLPTNCDLVALSIWREAQSAESALSEVESRLQLPLDDMSFQLQWAIRVLMLEVIDVTPPLEVGQDREATLYPFPTGWTYPKFQESVFLSDAIVPALPTSRTLDGPKNRKTRSALRWYVKSLATPWDVDRFAFLWIALEILASESAAGVEKPYVASCGHEIPSCPQCGRSTAREVQGPTLVSFLVEDLSVEASVAKELWRTCQMFHGNNDLTPESIKALPRHLLTLKSAVVRGLKVAAALSTPDFPIVSADVMASSKAFALQGTRKLEPRDLSAF